MRKTLAYAGRANSELVGDDALIVPPHMLIAIGKWVDVGIDPYRFLRRFSEYPGDCDRRESLEGATPVCATLRYDCHWQSLRF